MFRISSQLITTAVFACIFLVHLGNRVSAEEPTSKQAKTATEPECQVVPKLPKPFGTMVFIEGVVFEGPHKGYQSGPRIQVQRIDGVATQEKIRINLSPYYHDFGEKEEDEEKPRLPHLEPGKTYRFEGYESGGFVGVPAEIFKRGIVPFQTSGFHFQRYFLAYQGEEIQPIVFTPADFLDREGIFQGTAISEDGKAYIKEGDWKLLVNPNEPWSAKENGTQVETTGVIRKTNMPNEFRIESQKCLRELIVQ